MWIISLTLWHPFLRMQKGEIILCSNVFAFTCVDCLPPLSKACERACPVYIRYTERIVLLLEQDSILQEKQPPFSFLWSLKQWFGTSYQTLSYRLLITVITCGQAMFASHCHGTFYKKFAKGVFLINLCKDATLPLLSIFTKHGLCIRTGAVCERADLHTLFFQVHKHFFCACQLKGFFSYVLL